MAYDKVKKAIADSRRYWANKEQISAERKARRQAHKPLRRSGDPTAQVLRDCIEQGHCWWCNTGGWKRLAQHTAMAHQIYADDIREMAVLIRHTPTCVREESEVMSDRTIRLIAEGRKRLPDRSLANLVPHQYSEAGLASARSQARYMREGLTEANKLHCAERTVEALSKPHPCPVCGTIIPHSTPVCCSPECRKVRQNTGRVAADTRLRLSAEDSDYRLTLSQHQKRGHAHLRGSHPCPTCGKIIPKSRPKYCSPECSDRRLPLPIEDIKALRAVGVSNMQIAKMFGCNDVTIGRHLRKYS